MKNSFGLTQNVVKTFHWVMEPLQGVIPVERLIAVPNGGFAEVQMVIVNVKNVWTSGILQLQVTEKLKMLKAYIVP